MNLTPFPPDLRGVLPLFQRHIPAIADARRRLLAPGGVLIPRRDRLWAALVEDGGLYGPYAEPWLSNDYGLDLRAGHRLVVNAWRKVSAAADQLLAAPQAWATLDYGSIESPNVAGALSWPVERRGTAHGVLVWFDAELAEGIGFSNAPGQPELIYGQAFFPLREPVPLEEGDLVEVSLRADLIDDDYVWRWDTRVSAGADAAQTKASFRQSTLYGATLSVEGLKRREAGYTPPRSQAAEIDQYVLSLFDGRRNLSEMAEHLVARFPRRFPRRQDALTRPRTSPKGTVSRIDGPDRMRCGRRPRNPCKATRRAPIVRAAQASPRWEPGRRAPRGQSMLELPKHDRVPQRPSDWTFQAPGALWCRPTCSGALTCLFWLEIQRTRRSSWLRSSNGLTASMGVPEGPITRVGLGFPSSNPHDETSDADDLRRQDLSRLGRGTSREA